MQGLDNYSSRCAYSPQHREEAGIAKVVFLSHQNYEEALLPQLVAAAASITGMFCYCYT